MKSKAPIFWLTGLSGSGKTTIALAFRDRLRLKLHDYTVCIDADSLRAGVSHGLTFTPEDRYKSARNAWCIASMLSVQYITSIVSLINYVPLFREWSENSGTLIYPIWVKCPIDTCIKRDPKGLYSSSLYRIGNMVGTPEGPEYTPPENPSLILDTEKYTVEQCVDHLMMLYL